jgi:hypothetical protein
MLCTGLPVASGYEKVVMDFDVKQRGVDFNLLKKKLHQNKLTANTKFVKIALYV